MNEYEVIWRIDIRADSPEEAARMAQQIQRNPNSTASVFEVTDEEGGMESFDLDRVDHDAPTQ